MISRAQLGLYDRLFAAVQAVMPDADRLAMHVELGLPQSRKDWNDEHFDEWKRACLAITEPDNLDAQVSAQKQPALRKLYAVDQLLAQLGKTRAYAAGIARNNGMRTADLEQMTPEELQAVLTALNRTRRFAARRSRDDSQGELL